MQFKNILAVFFVSSFSLGAFAATKVSDEDQIRNILNTACKRYLAGDMSAQGAMLPFRDDGKLLVFDISPPRSKNYEQMRKDSMDLPQPTACDYLEIHPVILSKDAAYSTSVLRAAGKMKNGETMDFTMRSTDIWRKIDGRWYSVHEHNSFPVDPISGKADLQSKP